MFLNSCNKTDIWEIKQHFSYSANLFNLLLALSSFSCFQLLCWSNATIPSGSHRLVMRPIAKTHTLGITWHLNAATVSSWQLRRHRDFPEERVFDVSVSIHVAVRYLIFSMWKHVAVWRCDTRYIYSVRANIHFRSFHHDSFLGKAVFNRIRFAEKLRWENSFAVTRNRDTSLQKRQKAIWENSRDSELCDVIIIFNSS